MDHQDDNQPYTPYAPPTPDTGSSKEGAFIPEGRSISTGDSLAWISAAWGMFKRKPGEWILFMLICMAINYLLQKVLSFVGQLIVPFFMILLTAGLIYTCNQFRQKGTFALSDFFIAFKQQTRPLLMLGLFGLGFSVVLAIIMYFFFGGAVVFGSVGHMHSPSTGIGIGIGMIIVGILLMIAAAVIYIMAMWFAPALVMLHDIAPVEALKMSFSACQKNFLPGIVFFIVMGILVFVSTIPLGLGLLVTIPMFFLCYYISYRNVFFDGNS